MQANNISQIRMLLESIDKSLRILAERPTFGEEHPTEEDYES